MVINPLFGWKLGPGIGRGNLRLFKIIGLLEVEKLDFKLISLGGRFDGIGLLENLASLKICDIIHIDIDPEILVRLLGQTIQLLADVRMGGYLRWFGKELGDKGLPLQRFLRGGEVSLTRSIGWDFPL